MPGRKKNSRLLCHAFNGEWNRFEVSVRLDSKHPGELTPAAHTVPTPRSQSPCFHLHLGRTQQPWSQTIPSPLASSFADQGEVRKPRWDYSREGGLTQVSPAGQSAHPQCCGTLAYSPLQDYRQKLQVRVMEWCTPSVRAGVQCSAHCSLNCSVHLKTAYDDAMLEAERIRICSGT